MANKIEETLTLIKAQLNARKVAQELAKRHEQAHQVLRSQPLTEEKRDSVQATLSSSIQRNDNVTQTLTAELDASRKLRARLEKGEKINMQDSGIKKTLRLAAYSVAMDAPTSIQKLTQKEIENTLLVDLPEKTDFQKETLEEDFKEEMQLQPEGKILDELTVDPDNPDNQPDLDATLLLERGPENLPNIQGGIQKVRFYQEGNSIGVVLYTDKPNPSGANNILEHFEEVADRKLVDAKKRAVEMDEEKSPTQRAKETLKPTQEAKKEEEKPEKKASEEIKKEEPKAADKQEPKSTAPTPLKTTLARDAG